MRDSAAAIRTDVLVVGGGMAGAWAAIAAAQAGADVTLVDKGYLGTSGVTATGGPGHWLIPPDPASRREAIESQLLKAKGLGDPAWMERILDITWRHLPQLKTYPWGSDGEGGRYYRGVRGSEYMRALREAAVAAGVRILDHHPVVELLVDAGGRIGGARGVALKTEETWTIAAGAVILATGGCAFRSGLIGSHGNTGDGYLLAAEAGAELSGMEFSISYSLSPAWASTRTLPYTAARFYDEAGAELDIPPPRAGHIHDQALGKAMLAGTVYADLSEAPEGLRPIIQRIQPLTPAPFARRGVDLFKDRFPVKLFGEGTVRGSGGLRIADDGCRTTVPGLFAAGDAATRELVTGASSGGGAVNSAWALSSGRIAGEAAAQEALSSRREPIPRLNGVGTVAFAPAAETRTLPTREFDATIGAAIHDYDIAFWRTAPKLKAAKARLDDIWCDLVAHAHGTGRELLALRETASMAASARWCTAAALERDETRGIHERVDRPETRPGPASRLRVGGLGTVWTKPETSLLEVAA